MSDTPSMSQNQREQSERSPDYALGYSDREFKRLELQGALVRRPTEDLLRQAGLEPGMHVLDLGSGAGDVSLLAGELVGRAGSVLGVERSPEAAELARKRAEVAGYEHVRFVVAEIDAFTPD